MSENNTGGPAYPTISNVENKQDWITEEGMALRDYFAGQALALLGGRSWDKEGKSDHEIIETWAATSYAIADAMIKERNK